MLDWRQSTAALLDDMIALRRAIHADPELGLHTPATTAKVRAALKGLPLDFTEGASTTGFVATLRGPENGKTVLLRADMDALPLDEDTGLEFTSRRAGAMHACGHDTHVAMLVGAARALCARRDALAGSVQFMFQPGEEGWHGARFMLDDGVIDPLPDAAFALHVTPNVPAGVFAGRAGPMLAAADRFEISIEGRGGHASQPHDAIDPIPVATELVSAIHAMVTRRVPAFDPVVVTVGRIEAGVTNNVIPETAVIEGTIRSFSEASRTLAHEGIRRLAEHIPAAHLCQGRVDIELGFPVTVCDSGIAALAKATACRLAGEAAWMDMPSPAMGAEDFAYILQRVPGAMVFLGASPEGGDWRSCCALHSNRMVLDERVMTQGAAMYCAFAEEFLSELPRPLEGAPAE
ncbi:M20 metallopeptidase family protein [Candidatus Viadribacter manganicus]|uniref:Amidohydrolase n=1 Tax=Candidatus Viadribacter manganicus TaxID=1759059 RepID=A0A1B1AMH7_9PROT|nr:M20 family metallopeptidase [Candidatus Viadribacter manganicus]ANP47777.1 amidohydrolase [Candidatus Viadribacter manganicus]